MNAYEVMQKLRRQLPQRPRQDDDSSVRSPSKPTVFVDGIQFGEIQSLRTISARQVSVDPAVPRVGGRAAYGNGFDRRRHRGDDEEVDAGRLAAARAQR